LQIPETFGFQPIVQAETLPPHGNHQGVNLLRPPLLPAAPEDQRSFRRTPCARLQSTRLTERPTLSSELAISAKCGSPWRRIETTVPAASGLREGGEHRAQGLDRHGELHLARVEGGGLVA